MCQVKFEALWSDQEFVCYSFTCLLFTETMKNQQTPATIKFSLTQQMQKYSFNIPAYNDLQRYVSTERMTDQWQSEL